MKTPHHQHPRMSVSPDLALSSLESSSLIERVSTSFRRLILVALVERQHQQEEQTKTQSKNEACSSVQKYKKKYLSHMTDPSDIQRIRSETKNLL
jgi:hypothetical protein